MEGSGCPELQGTGKRRAEECRVSLGGHENVLKLIIMIAAQL